jgi:multimeric flavodoxin WrbA
MKMKVIGICGSPRKGNTEWMLNRILKTVVRHGIETELILLRKSTIRLCNGCLKCEAGGKERKGICTIKDDMLTINTRLLEAGALVLGTPVYFEMLSGLMKNFMDRTTPIWPGLEGKLLAGTAVAEEGIGQTIDNLKVYGSVCKMRWIGEVTALAKEKNEVARYKDIENKLDVLGNTIVRELTGSHDFR